MEKSAGGRQDPGRVREGKHYFFEKYAIVNLMCDGISNRKTNNPQAGNITFEQRLAINFNLRCDLVFWARGKCISLYLHKLKSARVNTVFFWIFFSFFSKAIFASSTPP